MPRRISSRSKFETNRKDRKLRWIRVKNLMRLYPSCSYNGDFYCDHVYDPERPWLWVDFRFFHTRLKKYFAVALITLEYEQYEMDGYLAYDKADERLGKIEYAPMTALNDEKYGKLYSFCVEPTDREFYDHHYRCQQEIEAELLAIPRNCRPTIEIKDYGPVAVGVIASVNKQFIDEHVIREFIKEFRAMGEPTRPGWKWEGDEVEVIPARINERFKDA